MKLFFGATALALFMLGGVAVDDFVYYAELEEEQQGPPPSADASFASGPSMEVVANSDGNFSVDCKQVLYDPNGGYWNLNLQARVFDPVGNQIGSSMNSAYKPSLTAWAIGNDPSPEDGTYKCEVDNYVEGQYIGQSLATLTVSFLWPTSLSVFSDQYLRHAFNDYDREIHYQVRDQNQNPLQVQGMQVTESYQKTSDTCNLPDIQIGTASTNAQGQFKDNYRLKDTTGCVANPTCSATFEQTISVANRVVRINEVEYDCYGVTVTPQ